MITWINQLPVRPIKSNLNTATYHLANRLSKTIITSERIGIQHQECKIFHVDYKTQNVS